MATYGALFEIPNNVWLTEQRPAEFVVSDAESLNRLPADNQAQIVHDWLVVEICGSELPSDTHLMYQGWWRSPDRVNELVTEWGGSGAQAYHLTERRLDLGDPRQQTATGQGFQVVASRREVLLGKFPMKLKARFVAHLQKASANASPTSDIVLVVSANETAFDPITIGTKVLDRERFLAAVVEAIRTRRPSDSDPYMDCPEAIPFVSPGMVPALPKEAEHTRYATGRNGRDVLCLDRAHAPAATRCEVAIYEIGNYLRSLPDLFLGGRDDAERLRVKDKGFTHVLVQVRAWNTVPFGGTEVADLGARLPVK